MIVVTWSLFRAQNLVRHLLSFSSFSLCLSFQEYDSDDASPMSPDVESFQGKIVYNPDGSAYIIDSENESHTSDSNFIGKLLTHCRRTWCGAWLLEPHLNYHFYLSVFRFTTIKQSKNSLVPCCISTRSVSHRSNISNVKGDGNNDVVIIIISIIIRSSSIKCGRHK